MVVEMESSDWAKLPGTLLPGGYEIEECFAASASSATFKVRILGDRFTEAIGEFFAAAIVSPEQVNVWTATTALRHRNVSQPLTAGLLDGTAYYIETRPDETLQGVVRERLLTVEETKEVARALVQGLSYLHGNGFAQGHLDSGSVAAIGDRICLRLQAASHLNAPLGVGEEASPAGDVRQLGQTLSSVLSREGNALSPPFDQIVARCLDENAARRPSLPEILSMLDAEPPAVVVAPPKPAPPAPVEIAPAAPVMPYETGPVFSPQPSRTVSEDTAVVEERRETGSHGPKRGHIWFYIPIAAILIAAALLWALRPKHQNAVSPSPSSWPSHEVGPVSSSTSTAVSRPPATVPPRAATSKHRDAWRVIAFTFRREADAQNRARLVNEKHPALHADVFSPSGGPPYLVVLGGAMTREEAEQLRRKARSAGMPRDTYVQNYNH